MINLLLNGGFDGNLNEWTGGTIVRSLGYPRLGCVQLDDGESISQQVSVSADTLYTLHFFYQLSPGASLVVRYGSIEQAFQGFEGDWQEGTMIFALDVGANESVTFEADDGTVYVDSVALGLGGLPISRDEIAVRLERRLGGLATDAGLSMTPSSAGPQGDYSEAIDEALRAVGAMSRYGDPDVTKVEASQVNDLIESAQAAMLQVVRASYALETDVTLGPRRESRSQIAASIDAMLGGGGGGKGGGGGNRRVGQGRIGYGDWPR